MLDVLSDDEALLIRAIIELSDAGPFVPERLIFKNFNATRNKRQLRPLSMAKVQGLLAALGEKGYVVPSLSRGRWRIAELAL